MTAGVACVSSLQGLQRARLALSGNPTIDRVTHAVCARTPCSQTVCTDVWIAKQMVTNEGWELVKFLMKVNWLRTVREGSLDEGWGTPADILTSRPIKRTLAASNRYPREKNKKPM
jgi:hypothetical protein